MAKKGGSADSVYKVVELVGTSSKSWEDAAKNAVETAAGSLRDLRVAEIVKQDMTVENGKVAAYRARVLVSFKYRRLRSLRQGSTHSLAICWPDLFCAPKKLLEFRVVANRVIANRTTANFRCH